MKEGANDFYRTLFQAAENGAVATTEMEARAGRASYVNRSQLTQPDPGAHAVGVWLAAIHKHLTS